MIYSSLDDSTSYAYTYDAYGRISRETTATGSYTGYSYDVSNQLRFATMYNSSGVGEYRYKYFYDNSGNLVNWYINNNDNTETYENHTYTYGNTSWADLLTAFDGYGIAYEGQTYNSSTNVVSGTAKSGNPISYYNGTRWTFAWSNGRQLTSASKSGTAITYEYDLNGIRTSKTVDSTIHEYIYASGKLLRETYGSNVLDFAYTASGVPFSLTYNGTTYYYITNAQGDVMYLVNAGGTRVATYTYDPYGKVLTATGTMASINPLRYRGYYYDTETGFYYLKSRYYDPLICRFINADGVLSTGKGHIGYNVFAYCNNNPVNYVDSDGQDPERVPSLWDYYNMHKAVQYDIAEKDDDFYPPTIEVYVRGPKGRGFLDIYDPVTGEYYEVKHEDAKENQRTKDQMAKYDEAVIRDWRFLGTTFNSSVTRGTDATIQGVVYYDDWEITYWYEKPGLILYSYQYIGDGDGAPAYSVAAVPSSDKKKQNVPPPAFGIPIVPVPVFGGGSFFICTDNRLD